MNQNFRAIDQIKCVCDFSVKTFSVDITRWYIQYI